jgi:hypothetical protein
MLLRVHRKCRHVASLCRTRTSISVTPPLANELLQGAFCQLDIVFMQKIEYAVAQ